MAKNGWTIERTGVRVAVFDRREATAPLIELHGPRDAWRRVDLPGGKVRLIWYQSFHYWLVWDFETMAAYDAWANCLEQLRRLPRNVRASRGRVPLVPRESFVDDEGPNTIMGDFG